MRFYAFGDRQKTAILLLPGTCCHWKRSFGPVIPLLERDFYVICASYDGFDESEPSVFPDMLTETVRIEDYIRSNLGGHVRAVYGCSLGGSFVGLLIQRRRIRMDHGILGSSDLDQGGGLSARLQARLIAAVLHGIFRRGALPGWMRRRLEKKPPDERAYMDRMLELFGVGSTDMAFVRKESIRNQFYSDLVTPLDDGISAPGTRVHVFYAAKMGEQYLSRYQRHFKDPDIRRHDLRHEELLVCEPQRWAEEVRCCCEMEEQNEQAR